jgi:protein-S-isoprenylcysteine O-methyltransferase Ste14
MTTVLFSIGALAAATLVGLLLVTLVVPGLRIWPTPGNGTWQSYVFWPLFRSLNVLCFAVALADIGGGYLGLPVWLRSAALALLAAAVTLFVYAFRVLGRDNSYCAQDGLVTGGIYRWSRNPQNAMLIVVYGALAVAADSAPAYVLCGAMMATYALMVLAEEPWLEKAYGKAYRSYCRQVPRFFNWRRAAIATRSSLRSGHSR